ncbi:hypothetical protein ACMHYB_31990 [Sorangium sp. So ce1128]
MPVPISLAAGEVPVGWYRNPPPWEECVILFTSVAVYAADAGSVTKTSFEEIVDYETPKDKVSVTGVRIRTADGFHFVRMAGRYGPDGKFGDVFNLLMILQVLVRRNNHVD